ncbi:hypothetical protein BSKO_12839 [Bryopsis sp. KO-2023]|nr:hypothetical protein BSKO_12839 [Bryopsis sp. KO-2023]
MASALRSNSSIQRLLQVCRRRDGLQGFRYHALVHNPVGLDTVFGNSSGVQGRSMCEMIFGLQDTLEKRRKAYGATHDGTLECMQTLAAELSIRHRFREAEPLFRRILVALKERKEEKSSNMCDSLLGLSIALLSQCKYDQAEWVRKDALEQASKILRPDSLEFANVLEMQAQVLLMHGFSTEASKLYRKILLIMKNEKGKDSPEVADILQCLADALIVGGEGLQAERVARAGMEVLRKLYGDDDKDIASMMHTIGNCMYVQGNMEGAEGMIRKALGMHVKYTGQDHSEVGMILHSLGDVVSKRGRAQEASGNYRRALEVYARTEDQERYVLERLEARVMFRLAEVLRKIGQEDEAEGLTLRAQSLARRHQLRDGDQDEGRGARR